MKYLKTYENIDTKFNKYAVLRKDKKFVIIKIIRQDDEKTYYKFYKQNDELSKLNNFYSKYLMTRIVYQSDDLQDCKDHIIKLEKFKKYNINR